MQKLVGVNARIDMPESCMRHVSAIIKNNREIFIMLSILNGPICGYDIIKNIFAKYDVFLSQGAVYPILYSMEEEGLLIAEYHKGDMRSKNYSFTPQGYEVAKTSIAGFAIALNRLEALITI